MPQERERLRASCACTRACAHRCQTRTPLPDERLLPALFRERGGSVPGSVSATSKSTKMLACYLTAC
jgi:hypothetical protein